MNLSPNKDHELRQRARAWFYHIGFCNGDSEDIIQRAILKLHDFHNNYPDVDQDDFADKNWRDLLRNQWIDWCRKNKNYHEMLERYADSIYEMQKRVPFIQEAREILLTTLPKLSESELLVVIALMDNGFNKGWTADDLGCTRQHIYQTLSRVRGRLTKDYDFSHNPNARKNVPVVPIIVKTGDYDAEGCHWNSFHAYKTEVIRADELTARDFWDKAENEKIWPVTIIKGEDYAG